VNEKFRKKNNIPLYYNYKMIGSDFFIATATYDKTNKKVYATVKGDVVFSRGDYVVIINGSSFLAKVEAYETIGDFVTMELLFDDNMVFWNSGSERRVLLKGLSNSTELEKPSAIIDVAAVPTPAAVSALQQQIELGTLTFDEAVQMAGLNSSSKVTVKNNQGNPKRMFETFVADKVKATLSKKGLEFVSERKKGKVLTSGQPATEVPLFHYLQDMRQELHEQQDVIIYTVTVIDKDLNVIMYNKPIKEVLKFKKDGKKGYRIKFKGELIGQFSGTFTVLIEKQTVTKNDLIDWFGGSGMYTWSTWGTLSQKNYAHVNYFKKNNDGNNAHLELGIPDFLMYVDNVFDALALFTVDDKPIYGTLKLTEDDKVILTKPVGMGHLAWDQSLAAIKIRGKGHFSLVEQGSSAKGETLQLKVGLDNVESALSVLRQVQNTASLTVGHLLSYIGPLKVLNAEIAPAKAGVDTLTAVATLATGTVKLFNHYIEILVKNNSRETCRVFNSNGTDEEFREVYAVQLLDAAVADVKKNYDEESQSILRTHGDVFNNVSWTANIQVIGESFHFHWALRNAEVEQTTSETTYRLFYDQVIPQFQNRFHPANAIMDGAMFGLMLIRTELIPADAQL
jgi:hypothetical protein